MEKSKKPHFRCLKTVLFLVLLAWALSYVKTVKSPDPATAPLPTAYTDYHRTESRTYLSFPEWYMVYISDEYARFIKDHPPSAFPYFKAIRQFWDGYRLIYRIAGDRYKFDTLYQIRIAIEGAGMSAELALKGAYENTLGRLSEMTEKQGRTEEEKFAANAAAEYVDFIRAYPWYEFDFFAKLRQLWQQTSLDGPDPVRKLERKFMLSAECAGMGAAGYYSKKLAVLAGEPPSPFTVVQAQNISTDFLWYNRDMRLIRSEKDYRLLAAPRYSAFKNVVLRLAQSHAVFQEIAGNQGEILITLITGSSADYIPPQGEKIFTQPLLTDPEHRRIAVMVPVMLLTEVISTLPQNVILEHVYDY